MENVAIITIDSLRYDTAMEANTPYIHGLFGKYETKWTKTYAQGTYTLPVHIGIFQDGHLPSNELETVNPMYTRRAGYRMFKIPLSWNEARTTMYVLPPSANIVKGFEKLGYRTVGVGGVNWFNTKYETSNFWKGMYFKEFYWEESFSDYVVDAFDNQIACIRELGLKDSSPLFFFLNIPSTHPPCRGDNSKKGQIKALEYVDARLHEVFENLPNNTRVILMSDHGTTFGEDGLRGHGFHHPNIVTVPMSIFLVE